MITRKDILEDIAHLEKHKERAFKELRGRELDWRLEDLNKQIVRLEDELKEVE